MNGLTLINTDTSWELGHCWVTHFFKLPWPIHMNFCEDTKFSTLDKLKKMIGKNWSLPLVFITRCEKPIENLKVLIGNIYKQLNFDRIKLLVFSHHISCMERKPYLLRKISHQSGIPRSKREGDHLVFPWEGNLTHWRHGVLRIIPFRQGDYPLGLICQIHSI